MLGLAPALAAQDPPVTLVLDDLHLLTDRTVLDGLDDMLRNTGSGLRLLVAARMDPLLPLHRHRLVGELTEIRASDLAFTPPKRGADGAVRLRADGGLPGVPYPAHGGLRRRPPPAAMPMDTPPALTHSPRI